ncbi:hypothetical protein F5Y01DRAFT_15400 [Xylaria sp. FL0043]|nr:hypothetical protein F5Y01DRAFT_15400 [Xylaria sp. FL0043]
MIGQHYHPTASALLPFLLFFFDCASYSAPTRQPLLINPNLLKARSALAIPAIPYLVNRALVDITVCFEPTIIRKDL